jgi:SAM domain (Sterile alpha motif)
MQEIADWLEKLGMSEYALRFAENDIDASVLPHLTDQVQSERLDPVRGMRSEISHCHRPAMLAGMRCHAFREFAPVKRRAFCFCDA